MRPSHLFPGGSPLPPPRPPVSLRLGWKEADLVDVLSVLDVLPDFLVAVDVLVAGCPR